MRWRQRALQSPQRRPPPPLPSLLRLRLQTPQALQRPLGLLAALPLLLVPQLALLRWRLGQALLAPPLLELPT